MGRAARAGVRVGLFVCLCLCFCVFMFVQGEASL